MNAGTPPPVFNRASRLPAAYATHAIVAICVLIQLLVLVMGPEFGRNLTLSAGLVPARLTGHVIGLSSPLPAWLTLITHIFLHGGLVHLAMNMVFLVWVGRMVEWRLGMSRFLLLFFLGGIAGGLAQVLTASGSVVPVVGASGAISAVFATYALLFARSGEEPARILGMTISGETVRAFRFACLWIGLQLLTAVAFNTGSGGIAIWSHIGGFLAGLLFGLPFIRAPKS
ncbi:rhomboid family intramembrane serine protease [Sandaracinobacteroides hominis]|uniref:rhomboid family intramembrane serine protease n=1 Tax=Sandaracinobacteroides hominis TaxID=2780086 RepID=UPI0018F58BFB|nr:rhomboid family intramembrane serine protease [Sandaracinobacteroides hominis]